MRTRAWRPSADGQILVVFAAAMVVLILLAGLVFDGAQVLARRRQLQDAGDAAALAAANVIQSGSPKGCSTTAGDPPGTPRTEVASAAVAMTQANLPGFAASDITVTCPDGYANYAVSVSLRDHTPGFFAGIAGIQGFAVGSTSVAMNGQLTSTRYSIVLLDPSYPTWPNGRQGCPSLLVSGGPTLTLEGSMMIDSACPASSGGALGTNGNAATITMLNDATIQMVGQYVPGALTITPAPMQGQRAVRDPFAGLTPVPVASLPVRSNSRLTLSGSATVLSPGVYNGGIQMKNSAIAYLRPGIYVMNGGGFQIGAQNAVYSIPVSLSSTTDATWATDCTSTNCGILLFNTGISRSTDQVSIGAGAKLMLRPYLASVDGSGLASAEYNNLLLWQDANPVPTNSFSQPQVNLSGGGSVNVSGTVYVPSALVYMTGGSGGSGGSQTDVTLQFVSWDLQFQGNSSFHFYYRSDQFAKPTDYGLIK